MSDIRSITYDDGVSVTPSDSADIPGGPFAAFDVGVAGDVTVTTMRGTKLLLKARNAGVIYTYAIRRIWATGTTASSITACVATNDVR